MFSIQTFSTMKAQAGLPPQLCAVQKSTFNDLCPRLYSGPQKSWPLLSCISYENRGHNFCGLVYVELMEIMEYYHKSEIIEDTFL